MKCLFALAALVLCQVSGFAEPVYVWTGDLPARVDLLSLDAGYAGPKPTIDLTGITLPKDYEVRWVGRKLRLGPPTGMLMIVR